MADVVNTLINPGAIPQWRVLRLLYQKSIESMFPKHTHTKSWRWIMNPNSWRPCYTYGYYSVLS